MVSVVELQIPSRLYLEKLFKMRLSSTYYIDEETKATQRIHENLKIWQGMAQTAQKEQTAKRPDTTAIGLPCVECARIPSYLFSELTYKFTLCCLNTQLLGSTERDTTKGCVGGLYQTDLLSKTGLGISNIEIIPSRITESPNTAFILVRCMGKGGFGLYHANISDDWPVHLGLRCFPEGSLIIYLSWRGGGVPSILVSSYPFLFRQMLALLLQFTRIGTGLRKSY